MWFAPYGMILYAGILNAFNLAQGSGSSSPTNGSYSGSW